MKMNPGNNPLDQRMQTAFVKFSCLLDTKCHMIDMLLNKGPQREKGKPASTTLTKEMIETQANEVLIESIEAMISSFVTNFSKRIKNDEIMIVGFLFSKKLMTDKMRIFDPQNSANLYPNLFQIASEVMSQIMDFNIFMENYRSKANQQKSASKDEMPNKELLKKITATLSLVEDNLRVGQVTSKNEILNRTEKLIQMVSTTAKTENNGNLSFNRSGISSYSAKVNQENVDSLLENLCYKIESRMNDMLYSQQVAHQRRANTITETLDSVFKKVNTLSRIDSQEGGYARTSQLREQVLPPDKERMVDMVEDYFGEVLNTATGRLIDSFEYKLAAYLANMRLSGDGSDKNTPTRESGEGNRKESLRFSQSKARKKMTVTEIKKVSELPNFSSINIGTLDFERNSPNVEWSHLKTSEVREVTPISRSRSPILRKSPKPKRKSRRKKKKKDGHQNDKSILQSLINSHRETSEQVEQFLKKEKLQKKKKEREMNKRVQAQKEEIEVRNSRNKSKKLEPSPKKERLLNPIPTPFSRGDTQKSNTHSSQGSKKMSRTSGTYLERSRQRQEVYPKERGREVQSSMKSSLKSVHPDPEGMKSSLKSVHLDPEDVDFRVTKVKRNYQDPEAEKKNKKRGILWCFSNQKCVLSKKV